ncbi:MAG: hypothetical protein AAB403_21630 [Planctomycetota bacterium]
MSDRARKAGDLMQRDERLDSIRAAGGDGAFFAALLGSSAKVASQKADKEGKRLRRVFAPRPDHKQTKGGIGYVTVGIIEPRFSASRGLFTEENCENRSKTYYR